MRNLIIISCALMISACGNRHVSKSQSTVDSTSHVETSLSVATKKDSTSVHIREYIKVVSNDSAKTKKLKIRFYEPTNKIDSSVPVVITWSDTGFTIASGNRAIKSVSGTVLERSSNSLSTKTRSKDSTHVADTSHRDKTKVTDTNVNKKHKDSDSTRTGIKIPGWVWVVLLIVCAAIVLWLQLRPGQKEYIKHLLNKLR